MVSVYGGEGLTSLGLIVQGAKELSSRPVT